jgi:hypothetical protein
VEHLFFTVLLSGKVYAHQVVRTDSREQKLDVFFAPRSKASASMMSSSSSVSESESSSLDTALGNVRSDSEKLLVVGRSTSDKPISDSNQSVKSVTERQAAALCPTSSACASSASSTAAGRRIIKLSSVLQLKNSVEANMLDS